MRSWSDPDVVRCRPWEGRGGNQRLVNNEGKGGGKRCVENHGYPGRVLQRSTVPDFEISKLKSFLTAHFSGKRDPVSREILPISDVFQFRGCTERTQDHTSHLMTVPTTPTRWSRAHAIYICMYVCMYVFLFEFSF